MILITVMLLASCGYKDKDYNLDIPDNTSSEKLIDIANEVVSDYWKGKNYHVGEVIMEVNRQYEGKVRIKYADESNNSSPHVIEVIFNTSNNKLEKIKYLGNDSKVDPGIVLIDEWNFNSNEALDIALEVYGDKEDNFDSIYIKTNNVRNYWVVLFFKNNIRYFVEVDPYSGEVISHGKEKIKN
jgi:hypothetical protein